MITSFQFIATYQFIVGNIIKTIDPVKRKEVIKTMLITDPHNLISPETTFIDSAHVYGFVWLYFFKEFQKPH